MSAARGTHSTRARRVVSGLAVIVATLLGLTVASPASALWTATSTGPYALAQAATLVAPAVSASSVTATSAALSWTQPFVPTNYALTQSTGALTGCAASPATNSTGCTASALVPNTSYTWTLSSSRYSWVVAAGTTATTPKQATTTTLSAITPTSGSAGGSFSATATVTGNSGYGTPAGTVVLALFTSSTCSGAASYSSAATTLTAGAATATLSPASAGTYYWRAVYTPTDTYNLTSTSACSAAITVSPAGPTIGAPSTVTNSQKDIDVAYPTGTVSGDLLMLVVVNNASQDAKPPSSWNLIAEDDIGGSNMEMQAWWYTAGAESSVTMEFKTNSSGVTAWVLNFGPRPSPVLQGTVSGTASTGTTLTPSTLTTTAANTTVVSLVGINQASTLSLGTANGFTFSNSLSNSGGSGRTLGIAVKQQATAGSVTSPVWSKIGSNSQWIYITVAFTPW